MIGIVTKQFRFDSAHWLPNVPKNHKCHNIHGHSYHLKVSVKGTVDRHTGFVIDLGELKNIVQPLITVLDHHQLNDISGLSNPTTELLCKWFWDKLINDLPDLYEIVIYETDDNHFTYYGE